MTTLAAGLAAVVVALGGLALSTVCWVTASRPRVLAGLLVGRRRRSAYRMRKDAGGRLVRSRNSQPSSRVGARLERVVLRADRRRCVVCGDDRPRVTARMWDGSARLVQNIVFDHRWPWAGGGLSWVANGAALCRSCNLAKGNYSVDGDGREHWHGDLRVARSVAASERVACGRLGRRFRLAVSVWFR